MKQKGQKGFTVFEIVLVLALVGLIAVAGYYAFQGSQKTPSPTATPAPTATSTSPTPAATNQLFRLSDWRVQLSLTTGLTGLVPGAAGASSYDAADQSVNIYAPELDSSWTCAAVDGHKGTIGSISRTSQVKRSGPSEPLATKKIGNYTYGFESSTTSNCTTNPKYRELVEGFRTAFQNLQAY